MSWKASAAVKELRQDGQGKTLTPSEKCLLYTLADYYDEERQCAWPSVKRAANESMISERQASRIINDLQKRGILLVEHRKNDTSLYRFQFGPYIKIEVEIPAEGGDNLSVPKELTPVTHDGHGPTKTGGGGDIAMSDEPPIAVKEPSTTYLFDLGSNGSNGSSQKGFDLSTSKKKNTGKPKPGRRFAPVEEVVAGLTEDPWEREKMPRIWKFYLEKTGKAESYMPSPERIKLGIERLRDLVNFYGGDKNKALKNYAVAIQNLANDEFLSGNNDRGKVYQEFDDHLCKDWKTFDKRLFPREKEAS